MMADGSTLDSGFIPGADTARAYRDALGQYATGVTIITIGGPAGPIGFTANSFASVSIDPALVLWSIARSARRFDPFTQARHFAIHVLGTDQSGLIQRFNRTGAGFDGLNHQINAQGVPLMRGALARFECEQHATHEGGDHMIVVGRVLKVVSNDGAPLVFSKGRTGQFVVA
jgi:flavin reductase (DIM6/NTAB) family NADH-FMN oxidoreductase RutF